jgi:hypothetical protein
MVLLAHATPRLSKRHGRALALSSDAIEPEQPHVVRGDDSTPQRAAYRLPSVIAPSCNYTHRWHGVLAGNYSCGMRSSARAVTYRRNCTAKAAEHTPRVKGAIGRSLGLMDTRTIL